MSTGCSSSCRRCTTCSSGLHLLVLTDGSGEVLWRAGGPTCCKRRTRLEFSEEADWSKAGIGTNANSEALVTGRPVQLLSVEYLVRTHHDWACKATPITDPLTGELLVVLDQAPEIDDVSMDGRDGYAAWRRRITQGWVNADVRNAVVLTGDVHRSSAKDLKVDYKDPASPVVGSELVYTSITCTGNGTGSTTDRVMAWNPHLKFYNDNRSYVNTKITKDALTADFRILDYVTTPGSPVSTKASFQIQDGVPQLHPRGGARVPRLGHGLRSRL